MSSQVEAVQLDWKNREKIEDISVSILRITEFLNNFEHITKSKLNILSDRLNSLERKMEFVENAVASVEQAQKMK